MAFFKGLKKRFKKIIRQLAADDHSDIVFKNNETVISSRMYVGKDCSFGDASFIEIGKNIIFGDGTKIIAISSFSSPHADQKFDPFIRIGNNVQVTASLQVYAMKEISIEDNVLFAANVFISDGFHGYDKIGIPYKEQPISDIGSIYIGEGSWIGQNVVILPGVTIGKFSIIGANSVVTRSIPAYTIATGVPARVIKSWDFEKNIWTEVKEVNKISLE